MIVSTKNLLSRLGTKKKLALQITSALVISSSVGTAAYASTQDSVTIKVDGKEQVIRTHADTVSKLLKDANIKVTSKDEVSPAPSTKVKHNMKIVVDKANEFTLTVNGTKQTVWSTAKTVQALLKEQNIQIQEHDKVTPSKDQAIHAHENITVEHAFPVTLNMGGQQSQVWSTSITVADFLKEQQVTLNTLDKVEPSLDKKVEANAGVTVTRVEKVNDVVEEPIPFAEVKKQDSSLTEGTEKVVQEGEAGAVQKTFEVTKENGTEVARNLLQEVKVKESKDRIVAVGTKQAVSDTPSRGNEDSAVANEFYVEATAYTPYCSGCEGVSAGGYNYKANPNMKLIAVDPRIIPLGTKVWVEGYGYAIAGDTGGAIKGYRIDVLVPTESQADAWGRKRVKIKVLK
ncbi:ubiquitin-like domain-containing protein [Microbacteriaceae bacterium 4G12]